MRRRKSRNKGEMTVRQSRGVSITLTACSSTTVLTLFVKTCVTRSIKQAIIQQCSEFNVSPFQFHE